MSIFSKQKKTVRTIVPLKECWYGHLGYRSLRGDDAVACNGCGAFYLVTGGQLNPVAKFVWVADPSGSK